MFIGSYKHTFSKITIRIKYDSRVSRLKLPRQLHDCITFDLCSCKRVKKKTNKSKQVWYNHHKHYLNDRTRSVKINLGDATKVNHVLFLIHDLYHACLNINMQTYE